MAKSFDVKYWALTLELSVQEPCDENDRKLGWSKFKQTRFDDNVSVAKEILVSLAKHMEHDEPWLALSDAMIFGHVMQEIYPMHLGRGVREPCHSRETMRGK